MPSALADRAVEPSPATWPRGASGRNQRRAAPRPAVAGTPCPDHATVSVIGTSKRSHRDRIDGRGAVRLTYSVGGQNDIWGRRRRQTTHEVVVLLAVLVSACATPMLRLDPLADKVMVDLIWQNHSDRRYFITVGDQRDNTLSAWFVVEPCERSGAWGVVVTKPDDVRIALAGDAERPTGPDGGGLDSETLGSARQWVFRIVQEADPRDDFGNLESVGPATDRVAPAPPEKLC